MTLALLLVLVAGQRDQDIVAKGATLQKLADGFAFTEGPVDDRAGNVYFTDQPNNRILKWTTKGQVIEWMRPAGRANGMAIDKKGNLIACADEKNELWSISPTQKTTVLVSDYQGRLLNGPNDVWIRPDGGMYITDPLYVRPYWNRDPAPQQPGQYVYFLPKKGDMRPVETKMKTPNGIVGTPDGKILYVADLGANVTYRFNIEKDGSLTGKQQFCALGSDGMTLDTAGNVYLSGKGVTVFDKTGKQIQHIDVPEDWVGHVCFGGKDHHLLFITASHGIYGLQMRFRGAY
ncbi:MAG TPA: SMP-30/gluconolactonase/LRE family protein [Fimbriimonas sp.]|nr:SMP-30/gluconolactonase/LRE family protein [Fimbriimonas sp.]